jgi:hypothetical protein
LHRSCWVFGLRRLGPAPAEDEIHGIRVVLGPQSIGSEFPTLGSYLRLGPTTSRAHVAQHAMSLSLRRRGLPALAVVQQTMTPTDDLVRAVQRNCDISDARHAGNFTLCIFLLKMREHYRWEKRLPFSATLAKEDVGDWLAERETLWNAIEDDEFLDIPTAGGICNPFDGTNINTALLPDSLVYSAGYGRYLKPHFFVGDLLRRESHEGLEILVSGREHARDMAAPAAMLQGTTVFVRQESIRREAWSHIEEWQWHKQDGALGRAMRTFGDHLAPDDLLERVTGAETETAILHELGEAMAGNLLGPRWNELYFSPSCGRTEIITRAVRDLLADALSTLPGLVQRDHPPALHYYFANLRGMRRELSPELVAAYDQWAASGDLSPLRDAAAHGADRWHQAAHAILDMHQSDPDTWSEKVAETFGLA